MVQTGPRPQLYTFPPTALLLGDLEDFIWTRSSHEGPSIADKGHYIPSPVKEMENVGELAPEGDQLQNIGLLTEVVETIFICRAPSTSKPYIP